MLWEVHVFTSGMLARLPGFTQVLTVDLKDFLLPCFRSTARSWSSRKVNHWMKEEMSDVPASCTWACRCISEFWGTSCCRARVCEPCLPLSAWIYRQCAHGCQQRDMLWFCVSDAEDHLWKLFIPNCCIWRIIPHLCWLLCWDNGTFFTRVFAAAEIPLVTLTLAVCIVANTDGNNITEWGFALGAFFPVPNV